MGLVTKNELECDRCGTRYAGVASGIEGPSSMVSY